VNNDEEVYMQLKKLQQQVGEWVEDTMNACLNWLIVYK
jgi:hypothetical protein